MPDTVSSVVVLLNTRFHSRPLVMGLAGGDSEDAVVTDGGVIVVPAGVAAASLHCIETGEDLELDEDYAVFHTGEPDGFVERFVPVLRVAVAQLGWPHVRAALQDYLEGQ